MSKCLIFILNLVVLGALAVPHLAFGQFSYHCEAQKLKNGKAIFDNQEIDLLLHQKLPTPNLAYARYSQGQLLNRLLINNDNFELHLRDGFDQPFSHFKLDWKNHYRQYYALRQNLKAYLPSDFLSKSLTGVLSISQDPVSGDIGIGLSLGWSRGQLGKVHFDLNFFGPYIAVQKKVDLPFYQTGYYAGHRYVQIEQETGMSVNIASMVPTSYINNSLKCRNRLLKNDVVMPTAPKDTRPFPSQAFYRFEPNHNANPIRDFQVDGFFMQPMLDIIFHVLAHRTAYKVSVPKLKEELKKSNLVKNMRDQSLDKFSKEEWIMHQINRYFNQGTPDFVKLASEEELTQVIEAAQELMREVF